MVIVILYYRILMRITTCLWYENSTTFTTSLKMVLLPLRRLTPSINRNLYQRLGRTMHYHVTVLSWNNRTWKPKPLVDHKLNAPVPIIRWLMYLRRWVCQANLMSVNSVKKIILNFKVTVYSALKYCKTSHKYTLLLTRYSSSFTIRYIYYTVHLLYGTFTIRYIYYTVHLI